MLLYFPEKSGDMMLIRSSFFISQRESGVVVNTTRCAMYTVT